MSDTLKKSWQRYLLALQTHPLRTKAITAGVLAGCNNMIAQKVAGAKTLQLKRPTLMFLYGFFYLGPFGHFYQKIMNYIFKGRQDTKTVAQKVVLEQLTVGPWNNLLFMVFFGLIIEGSSWNVVSKKIQKDYPSVQLNAWKVWPLVAWFSYRYVPIHLRVLCYNLAAACWGLFLNLKARSRPIKGT